MNWNLFCRKPNLHDTKASDVHLSSRAQPAYIDVGFIPATAHSSGSQPHTVLFYSPTPSLPGQGSAVIATSACHLTCTNDERCPTGCGNSPYGTYRPRKVNAITTSRTSTPYERAWSSYTATAVPCTRNWYVLDEGDSGTANVDGVTSAAGRGITASIYAIYVSIAPISSAQRLILPRHGVEIAPADWSDWCCNHSSMSIFLPPKQICQGKNGERGEEVRFLYYILDCLGRLMERDENSEW